MRLFLELVGVNDGPANEARGNANKNLWLNHEREQQRDRWKEISGESLPDGEAMASAMFVINLHDNENPNIFTWNRTRTRQASASTTNNSLKGVNVFPLVRLEFASVSSGSSDGRRLPQQQHEASSRCHLLDPLLVVVVVVLVGRCCRVLIDD